MTDKLTPWQGPPLTELAPLQNSISNELSNSRNTYVNLLEPDIRDILAEGREVVVRGMQLDRKVVATILEALMVMKNAWPKPKGEELAAIDTAIRAITGVE
jgi:hypothetical protein